MPHALWARRVVLDAEKSPGWDVVPPGQVSLDWGTDWARKRESVLAEVPSVIVPEESNVLINPRHADIERVGVRKMRRWLYDARLRGRNGTEWP